MTTTLQQMTDVWGNWLAAKNGTSCMFTSSTSYSDHFELADYTENQCNVQQYASTYQQPFVPVGEALVAYQTDYNNVTSAPQTESFQYTATTTQAFNWSITEALEAGASASWRDRSTLRINTQVITTEGPADAIATRDKLADSPAISDHDPGLWLAGAAGP